MPYDLDAKGFYFEDEKTYLEKRKNLKNAYCLALSKINSCILLRIVILYLNRNMIDKGRDFMAYKKYVVELTKEERDYLTDFICKGKKSAQAILKARILLKADQGEFCEGWIDTKICEALDTNPTMVAKVRAKFVNKGLEAVFTRKRRETPPTPRIFDGEAEAQLVALACSEPPEGHSQWSIRLLADRVVELGIVHKVHFNTVGRTLKKMSLSRT